MLPTPYLLLKQTARRNLIFSLLLRFTYGFFQQALSPIVTILLSSLRYPVYHLEIYFFAASFNYWTAEFGAVYLPAFLFIIVVARFFYGIESILQITRSSYLNLLIMSPTVLLFILRVAAVFSIRRSFCVAAYNKLEFVE